MKSSGPVGREGREGDGLLAAGQPALRRDQALKGQSEILTQAKDLVPDANCFPAWQTRNFSLPHVLEGRLAAEKIDECGCMRDWTYGLSRGLGRTRVGRISGLTRRSRRRGSGSQAARGGSGTIGDRGSSRGLD